MTPQGIRLNNPTNIRTGDAWLGAVGEENGFVRFRSPEYGIRAAARVLQTYQTTHGLRTVREIISRWAPPEDDNPTSEYARAVAIWMGVEPDDPVDVYDYDTAYRLLRAMVRFENGAPPDADRWYAEEVYEMALRMAGVGKQKSLRDSRVIRGSVTAAGGILAAQGILTDVFGIPSEIAALLPTALAGLSENATAGIVLLIGLAGAGYAMWARRDDSLKGRL